MGVDRISALACLLVIAWLGVALDPGAVPDSLVALLGIATAAMLVASVAAIAILRRRGLGRLLPAAMRPWAAEVAAVLRGYGRDREVQLRMLILGLAFQGLMVSSAWALGEGLRLDLDPTVYATIVPLVLIATLVPFSVAGFGVREGAYVALLAEVGVTAAEATLLSLLTVAVIPSPPLRCDGAGDSPRATSHRARRTRASLAMALRFQTSVTDERVISPD